MNAIWVAAVLILSGALGAVSPVVVTNSASLSAALQTTSEVLELRGVVTVDPRHFRRAAVIADRQVTLATGREVPGVLDFGGTSDVIFVAEGGVLTLHGTNVRGLAQPNTRGAPAAGMVLQPSLQLAPGAKVVGDGINVQYPRHEAYDDCPSYQEAILESFRSRYRGATVEVVSPHQLHVPGPATSELELVSYGRSIGVAMLSVRNLTLVCTEEGIGTCQGDTCYAGGIMAQGRAAREERVAALLLRFEVAAAGFGVLFAVTAVLVCVLLALRARTQRKHDKQITDVKEQTAEYMRASMASGSLRLGPGSADFSVTSDSLRGFSLDGGLPDVNVRSSSVSGRSSACGGEGLVPISPQVRNLSQDSQTACTLTKSHSGNASLTSQIGPYGPNHNHLMKMRMEGGLEGIELGPLLGRGSYGRVFKGRWKGVLVAIKVVEHNMSGSAMVVEGARESLLAASVAHPNVVACFKIVTVALQRSSGSQTDADGFPMGTSQDGKSVAGDGSTIASVITSAAAQAHVTANLAARSALARSASSGSWPIDTSSPTTGGGPVTSPAASDRLLPATVLEDAEAVQQHGSRNSHGGGSERSGGTADLAAELYASDPAIGKAGPTRWRSSMRTSSFHAADIQVLEDPLTGTHEPLTEGLQDKSIETWMLLEYADRGSLDQAIAAKRFSQKSDPSQLDLVSICRTLLDIVNGMSYLHGLGLLHADLKPQNILLKSTTTDPRGFIAKLADFGLSRVLEHQATHVSTQTFGTIPYMPPELLNRGRMAKPADVYSFAIVMWQMFAGTSPHQGMTTMQVMYNVVHEKLRLDVPSAMPPAYVDIMQACWAELPEDRPSFAGLHEQLSQQLETEMAVRLNDRQQRAFGAGAGGRSSSASRRPSHRGTTEDAHPASPAVQVQKPPKPQSGVKDRDGRDGKDGGHSTAPLKVGHGPLSGDGKEGSTPGGNSFTRCTSQDLGGFGRALARGVADGGSMGSGEVDHDVSRHRGAGYAFVPVQVWQRPPKWNAGSAVAEPTAFAIPLWSG